MAESGQDVAAATLGTHLDWLAGMGGGAPPVPSVSTTLTVTLAELPLENVPAVAAALAVLDEAARTEVADRDGFARAAGLVATLAEGQRAATEYKSRGRAPMKEQLDKFDSSCNEVLGQLATARTALNERMSTWHRAEEVLNSQLAADATAAAEALNEQLAEKARQLGLPVPPPVELYVGPPAKSVAAGTGKVVLSSRWTYDIEDASAVPREYCEPSAGLLRKAVSKGVRSIPGVRIYQTDSSGYRA